MEGANMAPQRLQPWTGVRKATKFKPMCYQYKRCSGEPPIDGEDTMSEDCLYLNVYTPDIKPKNLLPVMIFIHGGAYVYGSGDDDYYDPQFLVKHGVLLITFNYRLEAIGFLSLDTPDIPGNAGMKDQVEAFRWVKNNIINFGGDPDNITIFGQSSGAGCVSYHLISPMTRGLFRRAICQSGAAGCWWAGDFGSKHKALLLARQLGCYSEDDETLNKFFKKQPVQSLVNLKLLLFKSGKPYECCFSVVDEKDFGQERYFYGDLTEALQNGAHEGVDIMTGYTKDDGLITLVFGCTLQEMVEKAKYSNEFFVPKWFATYCLPKDQLEVGRKMRQFYFNDKDVTEHSLKKFMQIDMISYGIIFTAKQFSKKNKVYFYKFSCLTERNICGRVFVSEAIPDGTVMCHSDDLSYIFPVPYFFGKVDESSETYKIIERVCKLWTNFAKYGNPTPDKSLGVDWMPYTLEKQEYLDIGNSLKIVFEPDKDEIDFWEKIFKEHLPQYAI
ncbi:unnamed protein product [Arctia plantaginis]|uniref:Carboxylic ester hydrolase n=1 Tax=Arctia plantaginis TaxID=874455 RepID=A0A8S0YW29_ARCPL|nr:unnamed protein product [Arctia plantaginis]